MKKKFFLKFFLFTVLATLVTFTACKNYDDDIDALNDKITSLTGNFPTMKAELQSQIDAVKASAAAADAKAAAAQAAATAASQAGGDAKTAAAAAKTVADKAAVDVIAAQTKANAAHDAAVAAQAKADAAHTAAVAAQAKGDANATAIAEAAQAAQALALEVKANADAAANALAVATAAQEGANAAADAAADAAAAAKTAHEAAEAAQLVADTAKTSAEQAHEKADALRVELDALVLKVEAAELAGNATQTQLTELATEIAATKAQVMALFADYDKAMKSMVTSIRLISDKDLLFQGFLEQANVFVKDLPGAITFTKDKQVLSSDFFVIQVSPADAELTPEMISIQNGKGEVYENLEVLKVERHSALITRATANTGLWKVTVKLKEYEKVAFDKAAGLVSPNKVAFAVAIGNEQRKEISEYDLILDYMKFVPAGELFFFVGDKHVKNVNNRFLDNSKSIESPGTGVALYAEKTWADITKPSTTPINSGTGANTASASATDNRSTMNVYPAVQGKAIKIALTKALADTKATVPSNIKGMYVTLDVVANAIESAPSEWNAWNSYSYSGLNTVVTGTETEIMINSNTAIKDMIGFRVYAVNHDGTLVDPDGKAFYVSLGNEATDWNAVNTIVTATQKTPSTVLTTKSALANIATTKLTGATTMEWTTFKADGTADATPTFNAYFVEANGTSAVFNTTALTTIPTDYSKAVKVYTMATVNDWLAYKDNHVYNGKLTIKNATGHILTTLNVTFKKELPTAPTGFSVKSEQLTNGVYYSYLNPDNWGATLATAGTMPLGQVFNFGSGTIGNFETTFAASQGAGSTLAGVTVNGAGTLSVGKSFVDNTTQHATKVVYNFGKISSETKNSAGTVVDYKATIKEFPTVYSNIYNDTYSWNWATRVQLGGSYITQNPDGSYVNPLPATVITYGDAPMTINLGHVFGISTRDGIYSRLLDNTYNSSLVVQSAKLVSNSNNLDEYFSVTPDPLTGTTFSLIQKSTATNPSADVASTLILKAKDMYNNDVTIKLPFTVKKR